MLFARIEKVALFQFGIRSFLIPAAFAKNCGAVFRKMDACLRNNRPFSFSEKETKTWGIILLPHSERTVKNMAIYHLEAKVITRGVGRSVVAAAAYMSCSKIYNDYDGIQHDYTRKQGLVWEHVFLPEYAPQEWRERNVLWNAVEAAEKSKDSRLARELIVALPVEVGVEEWKSILHEFITKNCVDKGMCADVSIHNTDGHNPHAHILLTVRPLDEKGKWQSKTQKEYLCVKDGDEKGFTAAEFKSAQAKGWEKQYQYKVGKKKVYLPPSLAEAQGYERVSKNPKSTRFGRQNPLCAEWNSEEQILTFRKAWEEAVNKSLEQKNIEARIDRHSFADRGIDEQPTIHEGVTARILEKQGLVSERCEVNRQIRKDNALLRQLKALVKSIAETVKNTVPAIADRLETMRKNIMVSLYHLYDTKLKKQNTSEHSKQTKADLAKYAAIAEKLSAKVTQRKTLLERKTSLPAYKVIQHRELAKEIAQLTEEIQTLNRERKQTLERLNCKSKAELKKYDGYTSQTETALQQLSEQESRYSAEIDQALAEFAEVRDSVEPTDKAALIDERIAIRPKKDGEFDEYVKSREPKTTAQLLENMKRRTDNRLLHEDLENERKTLLWEKTRKALHHSHDQSEPRPRKRKSRDDKWTIER